MASFNADAVPWYSGGVQFSEGKVRKKRVSEKMKTGEGWREEREERKGSVDWKTVISSFQRGHRGHWVVLTGLSRLEVQSRRSQCFRKLSRFTPPSLPPSFALTIQPHFSCPSKKSIGLCKVQLGPGGGPASCWGLMQSLKGGQEASSRPVPQAVSRTDLRTKGLRPPDCPSPLHLTFSLSLSAARAWLAQRGRRDR